MSQLRRLAGALVATGIVVGAGRLSAQAAPQAPAVTIGGLGYFKYYYNVHDTANANNIDIDRFYINVNGKFTKGVFARFTSDLYRPGTTKGSTADNSLTLRIKYAYVGFTPDHSPLTFKLGVTQTPWLADWDESMWDYRNQGTMALERNGYQTSADLGFTVDGNFKDDVFNFSAGVFDGEGYGFAPGDKGKDLAARATVRLLKDPSRGPKSVTPNRLAGLRLTGFAQIGTPTGGGTRQRYVGMLSWRSDRLTLAAQFDAVADSISGTSTHQKNGTIGSVYGVLRFPGHPWEIIGRWDTLDPDNTVANDNQDRIIAGVSYTVSKNLRILADVDNVSYKGTATTAQLATRTQALLQVQLSF